MSVIVTLAIHCNRSSCKVEMIPRRDAKDIIVNRYLFINLLYYCVLHRAKQSKTKLYYEKST